MMKIQIPLSFAVIVIVMMAVSACTSMNQKSKNTMHGDHKYTNALVDESSPYLLQHAYNPVNWRAWNDETLELAKKEDKLMIISVGYAACHWCHVMEHESFEDSTVAAIMNENFISIKVDREERPDVDNIYMTAAYMTTGRGGWPLNAIALPDGRPVFGGTYYKKNDWIKVLEYFINAYEKERDKLESDAVKMEEGIKGSASIALNDKNPDYNIDYFDGVLNYWLQEIDLKKGGPKTAPKFPMPSNWEFLLEWSQIKDNEKATKAREAALVTLDRMATGGIYDHVGGGFARYSVDDTWTVPHFEKMMYDNGQLVSLYSKAYQATGKQMYKDVVYETLEWVNREMTDASGGFYSSLDADSEGEEGKYYVWSKEEIENILGDDSERFIKHFGVSKGGNFEGHNILLEPVEEDKSAANFGATVDELRSYLDQSKKTLFTEREKRIRPGLDDKILTTWNALMLKGYLNAYNAFDDPAFLESALKNAAFIEKHCIQKDNRLTRNHKDGKSTINAFIQDYASVADAFISLYQTTFDEKWLYKAKDLVDYSRAHFYDDESKLFFYTSDEDRALITRDMDWNDNVIPSGNSIMAKVLYQLGTLLYDDEYIQMSKQMMDNVRPQIAKQARFFTNWLQLASYFNQTPYEIAIVGENAEELRKEMAQRFIPNSMFLGGKDEGSLELLKNKLQEGETTIYVCQNKVCKLPVNDVESAMKLITYD